MDIPQKLTPIAELDRGLLPDWIEDFGTVAVSDDTRPMVVMTARAKNGKFFHIDFRPEEREFDDGFWVRYADPAVNCLGAQLFEAEYPDLYMETRRWEWAEAAGEMKLTDDQRAIITRREALTWRPPVQTQTD